MSMSNTVTTGTGATPLGVHSPEHNQVAAIEDAKILAAHTIRKFWVHDPNEPGEQKGHPRTLIAFKVDAEKGVITYAHTTWNPDYPEAFDRAQAVKRAEGRLMCPKRQHTVTVGAAGDIGIHMTILMAMAARDGENDRINTARYSACRFAMRTRTFKATD
jgi:hypothetical protein